MFKEFEEIIGYESIKKDLELTVDIMRNKAKYERLGVKTPHGLFLYGEPGVGKTTIVNCFIKASGRPSFICRKDKADGDFINKIRETFDEAKKNAPSIVFLDDMDKFANEDEKHKDAEEYVTVQSCIDDVKNEEVFIVATANDFKALPDSLKRVGRFDKTIEILAPTGKDAEAIVKYYLGKKSIVQNVDAKLIAKILSGNSCACLETVINEAGVYAGFANKEFIEMEDIVKACLRVLYGAPEKIEDNDKQHLKETAYHEAGHAVIAEIFEASSVPIVSVKGHAGEIGGITVHCKSDSYWYSLEEMKHRVIGLMGGKAATEIVFDKVDVGAGSDLLRAFRVIERFVMDYCACGFEPYTWLESDASVETKNEKYKDIHAEMQKCYENAKKILINNREFLDKLANELIEKETLIYDDIQRIKATCKIVR